MKKNDYFKSLSRKQYIEKTYQIIEKEGTSAISIRRLAKEAGCSGTNLYRHFESLEELLFYARMRYLQDYVDALEKHEQEWKNPWEVRMGVWTCYSRQAFLHPEAYQCIFFGNMSSRLPESLREYYKMFPDKIEILSPHLQGMLRDGDFLRRDLYLTFSCVEAGDITMERAKKMSLMSVCCFEGIFKSVLDGRNKKSVDELVDEVLDCLRDIVVLYTSDLDFSGPTDC